MADWRGWHNVGIYRATHWFGCTASGCRGFIEEGDLAYFPGRSGEVICGTCARRLGLGDWPETRPILAVIASLGPE